MLIFEIIGIAFSGVMIVFLLLSFVYARRKKDVRPVIPEEAMPKLQPIPIPTKDHSFLMRLLIWMFNKRLWRVSENWFYDLDEKTRIVIPRNFDFDGASIPRPFWFFLSPVGLLLIPAIVHDYGYYYGMLWKVEGENAVPILESNRRTDWDALFKKIGKDINGFAAVDWIAWLAVYLFGWWVWKKDKPQAPRPILKKFSIEEKMNE